MGAVWHQPGRGQEPGVQGAPVVQWGLTVECKGGLAEAKSAEAACRGPGAPWGVNVFLGEHLEESLEAGLGGAGYQERQ